MVIRSIQASDNAAIAAIIRSVMPEFGAGRQGTAMHDGEVNDMFGAYTQPRTAYFVCEVEGKLVGGGGLAPLVGGDPGTCELRKMYFLKEGRGKGWGNQLLQQCLIAAKEKGFEYCYLETFSTMNEAMRLYERSGFQKIQGPLGNTGHFACDVFYGQRL